jgi:hypothetical protein
MRAAVGRFARHDEVLAIALDEMAGIVGEGRPALAARAARIALRLPASSLARSLVALDRDLAHGSLRAAALARLAGYGVTARVASPRTPLAPIAESTIALPRGGPLLVVSNHPGLYDALALFAAIGRDDLAVIAARRPLFAALPNVAARLLAVEPGARAATALRAAVRHLEQGGALLHFPAGRIEPDPRIAPHGTPLLAAWQPGVDLRGRALARLGPAAAAVPAIVSGVLSRRARALARALGGRGLTDALVPLLELTFPGFGDVDVRVAFGEAAPADELAVGAGSTLRARGEALAERAREA